MPPALTNSSGASSRTAATGLGAAGGQLAGGARLQRADRERAQRTAAGGVAEAGDVRLVGHDPDERQLLAREDRAGERDGLRGGVDGRALGADDDAPAERAIAGVEVDAHADRRYRAPAQANSGSIRSSWATSSTITVTRARGSSAPSRASSRRARAVGGGVGDDDVLELMPREPDRLGQRERERAREPLAGEHARLQRAAAHRLAREADRPVGGAAFEVGGVGPQRVEIDERERWVEIGRGAFEALQRDQPSTGPSTRSV